VNVSLYLMHLTGYSQMDVYLKPIQTGVIGPCVWAQQLEVNGDETPRE
jgi:hypothetical protein